jgi:hypothetical protein
VQEGTGPQPNLVNLNETELYLEDLGRTFVGLTYMTPTTTK